MQLSPRSSLLLLALALPLSLSAGKPKKPSKKANKAQTTAPKASHSLEEVRSLYRAYQLDEALEAVERLAATAEEGSPAQLLQAQVQRARQMASRADKLELIDSSIVAKSALLEALGVYEPGLRPLQRGLPGDSLIQGFSYRDELERNWLIPSGLGIEWRSKVGGEWEVQPLSSEALKQEQPLVSPVLLEDGTTLLFARQSTSGLGGYDLYLSRLREGGASFYEPTLLGMPYNSPYNDYLLSWHEAEGWGTLVSDRFCAPDSVHIYRFTTKPSFLSGKRSDSEGDERFDRTRSSLSGLALTGGKQAQRSEGSSSGSKRELHFILQGTKVYRRWADFQNPEALKRYKEALEGEATLQAGKRRLEALRHEWASATDVERQQLASQILQLETQLRTAATELEALYHEVRRLEGLH